MFLIIPLPFVRKWRMNALWHGCRSLAPVTAVCNNSTSLRALKYVYTYLQPNSHRFTYRRGFCNKCSHSRLWRDDAQIKTRRVSHTHVFIAALWPPPATRGGDGFQKQNAFPAYQNSFLFLRVRLLGPQPLALSHSLVALKSQRFAHRPINFQI